MYVRLNSSYQIVTLPDDFLTLKNINGDELTFELKYKFDQEIGIKQNTTSVRVEIAKEQPPSLASVPMNDSLDPQSIVQFKNLHAENIKKYFNESVIATIASDPTKNISNEVVPLFNQGYVSDQIPQLSKTALVPVRRTGKEGLFNDTVAPIHAQHDLAITNETQQQVAETILLRGRDPSSAYDVNDLGLSLAEAHNGTMRRSPAIFNDETEKALYTYKNLSNLKTTDQKYPGEAGVIIDNDVTPDAYTLQRKRVNSRYVDVKNIIKFVISTKNPDKLVLMLNVRDSAGVTIQQLSRTFYPREYIKYYSIPSQPPIVKMSARSNKTYAMLAIKQVDPVAAHVRVYKRVYDHYNISDEPYSFVGEFDLTLSQGWKQIPVEISLGNTTIYRVVPTNELGIVGSDFASVVVKPQLLNSTIKRVVMTTKPQTNGVLLEITKLPSDAVSFQIMREDVTLDIGTLVFIETPNRVETADPNRVYTVLDTSVKFNHVYAYYCRIFRRNGSHEDRLTTHYEHIPLVENIVETRLVDATSTLTSNGYDVQFTITTTVLKTRLDQVKQLLEKQGLYSLFANDVTDVREQLGKLVSHNVRRVDLTTGDVEDFGTVNDEKFSDLGLRNVAGVSELKQGRKYRYIVTPLLRAPETLLESYVKSATDVGTSRLYTYKPFKFLHPIVAQRGNIVTPSSIRKNYSKDPMTFGDLGAYTTLEIALDKEKSSIMTAVREKKGSDVDILTWVLKGTSKDVDHFQIIAEHGGKRSIIGKSTCVPEIDNFVYVRHLEPTEVGLDIRYYVCPVYHDFTRGIEILVSNAGDNT